jgi:asparagine synthase (glutamine-hydrolysing)
MACGVEVRVPFLDLELVELAFSISSDVVYHRSERKSLLKRSVRDLLPPTVLTARKKGFSTPMKQWMRRGILEHGTPLLLDGRLVGGGVLDRGGVARLIEHGSPKHVWLLLVAELWARRWLEGEQEIRSLFPDDPRLWDRAEAGSPGAVH